MTTNRLFLVATAALAVSAAAQPTAKNQLTSADKDKEITVKRGATVTLRLPSNPSTGYVWYVLTAKDPCRLTGRKFIPDTSKKGMVGVGGEEVFTFKAMSEGSSYVRLISARPFDANLSLDSLWQARITVTK